MNNATENVSTTCTDRDWCDLPAGHDGAHETTADFPDVTATGNRNDFRRLDDGSGSTRTWCDGIQVPRIDVWLVEQQHPSNTIAHHTVQLTVTRDEDRHATCHMTLSEARLLVKHLNSLLQLVELDPEEVAGR